MYETQYVRLSTMMGKIKMSSQLNKQWNQHHVIILLQPMTEQTQPSDAISEKQLNDSSQMATQTVMPS